MCPPPGGGGGGGGGAPSPPPAVPTASVQLSYSVSGPGVLSLSPGIVSNVLTTIAVRARPSPSAPNRPAHAARSAGLSSPLLIRSNAPASEASPWPPS